MMACYDTTQRLLIIMNLLPLPTPHRSRLGPLEIYISPQLLHCRLRRLLSLCDRLVHLHFRFFVQFLLLHH